MRSIRERLPGIRRRRALGACLLATERALLRRRSAPLGRRLAARLRRLRLLWLLSKTSPRVLSL